ncbi:nacht and wd domain protein [Phlyctema vagabunda]|uniref:Nacht and wd domain protein n=1 Tax=Phlyctema vagabunda TaxID=108571 RepID=A0ABR4PC51_9HELO
MWRFRSRYKKKALKPGAGSANEAVLSPSSTPKSITQTPTKPLTSISEGLSTELERNHLDRQKDPASRVRESSPPSHSTTKSSDHLGLNVIFEPEDPLVDIIFVHGLGGTSRATWSYNRDLDFFWPGKWLPLEPDIQNARILSFGYNAHFAAPGPAPIAGISDFAKDLLFEMKYAKNKRLEDLEIGKRPLIFIAHSMGGLVVKKVSLSVCC